MPEGSIAITGGHGFLGWHLASRLRALDGVEAHRWGRTDLGDGPRLEGVGTIYHAAGVNRADDPCEVERGNVEAARALARSLPSADRPLHVVYANSIQADGDSAYGRGKRAAGDILGEAVERVGGSFVDVVLPNLFGEHGRPSYNSFVATFAHAIAHGETPHIDEDREVPLLHAQRAAEALRRAGLTRSSGQSRPDGTPVKVSTVLELLRDFHASYVNRGELPSLTDDLSVDLFNTYRSYLFPDSFPMASVTNDDARGRLFETSRSRGGPGQTFVSTTVPGATRGHHYHLTKVERFFVVKGDAEISLRRLLHDDVVRFRLSGDRPSFVDMPTLWVHSITNVGEGDLVTMFWANQLLDPDNADQFPEQVEVAVS